MKIYLDNAATTKTAPEVLKAMRIYDVEKYGNASSIHSFGAEAKQALEKARAEIAKKINALPEEIIFNSGGTEGDNFIIKGVARALKHKGNRIVISAIEHPAILGPCETLEKDGFEIIKVPVDSEGIVRISELKKAVNEKTILVSIMHANNEIGTVQPIAEIGRFCKQKGVLFHTDAVHSLSKIPIDVKKMNIDMATFSAHKFHGPKGIGCVYIKKGTPIKKLLDGGPQEFGLRAGTENVASAVGFAKALSLVSEKDIQHMKKLRDHLIEGILKKIPGSRLNGSRTKRLCNNVNVSFEFAEGEAIVLLLDKKGIAASTGSACSSHKLEPSHVLTAIGLPAHLSHGSIRLTLSKYTTKKEIDYTIKCLAEIVAQLRHLSPLKQKIEAHKKCTQTYC